MAQQSLVAWSRGIPGTETAGNDDSSELVRLGKPRLFGDEQKQEAVVLPGTRYSK